MLNRFRQRVSGLAGELRGLPGQGGYDTAALREEILQSVGVQRTVSLPQCLPQVKELLALFRLGAQQKVRRPGCEGGATGGMDPAGIVHPAGCLRGGGRRLLSGDEVGRRRGVQLVEDGFHVLPCAAPAVASRVQSFHTSARPPAARSMLSVGPASLS
ncbi:hypothetical protein [Streptomyces sp. SAS_269]|uniref:hypothetical protein n=1 Tax=Streptomyces sp. SAS_269 TaxID=3412749 RepID=UPI00403C78AD